LLSFGYTLLAARMESAVLRAGLDPALGSFHAPEASRASLALDLIEEFRPVLVDALVLRLINRRQLSPADFEQLLPEPVFLSGPAPATEPPPESSGAVWLADSGRRIFFREWSRRLRETVYYEPRQQARTLEDILQLQVYHYARVLRQEDPDYRPFVPR
jgi:CRISPR-associated protein Cas1